MNEIKIRCPKCGKILRLADAPNIDNAAVTCPVCNEKSRVGDCQRVVIVQQQVTKPSPATSAAAPPPPADAEKTRCDANIRGNIQNDDKTIYTGREANAAVGCLVDGNGRCYQLRHGMNTVGRKAPTSTATIQIDVADKRMSRSHATIEVSSIGGKSLHIMRNVFTLNPSYINNALIAQGDEFILNNGDRLVFGNTELIFRLP